MLSVTRRKIKICLYHGVGVEEIGNLLAQVFQALPGPGGNGDAASGDGYRYRGRGLFQLTFRGNYREAGNDLHLPLEDDPDRVATPEIAALTAAHYWHQWGLNALADPKTDFEAITRRINGGLIGIDKRKEYWCQAQTVMGNG